MREILKNQIRPKVKLSNEVIEFIKGFNIIETATADKDGNRVDNQIYWINQYFKQTEDPTVFEVVTEGDLIANYCKNSETVNKGITSTTLIK